MHFVILQSGWKQWFISEVDAQQETKSLSDRLTHNTFFQPGRGENFRWRNWLQWKKEAF